MEIKFLSVGCGDGIIIRFLGEDNNYHNIIIDGGTEKGNVYENTLRLEITKVIDRNEKIDLWIISHIDDDHIGGVLRFINDKELIQQYSLNETIFWYNDFEFDYNVSTKDSVLLSPNQSQRLREYLLNNAFSVNNDIHFGRNFNFHGLKIIILSPCKEKEKQLENSKKDTSKLLSGQVKSDWDKKIEDLNLNIFEEDSKKLHFYSVAFLLIYNQKNILLTSDSYPSIIEDSLKLLGYNTTNKLNLELMQLAHHGSKYNTSNSLLQMINCSKFVISADGYNRHKLPNKETIARVIKENNHLIELYITHKNDITDSLFEVDKSDIKDRVSLLFPNHFSNFLVFKI